ncbi:MAG: hypothetical protein J0H23_10000 [Micrococcales bacterium]|nr:hypothetical protein [Micrococcales bacterium]OJX69667.1 MAG: hypothetical protein BGO94_14425 [Micrococcales bacterium 72-143]
MSRRDPLLRAIDAAAGTLALLAGLGFGIPAVVGAVHMARYHGIWTLWGFPSYGRGAFEQVLGIRSSVPLIIGFAVVCLALCVTGVLVVIGRRQARRALAVVLVPALVYCLGFTLPSGIVAVALIGLLLVVASLILRR